MGRITRREILIPPLPRMLLGMTGRRGWATKLKNKCFVCGALQQEGANHIDGRLMSYGVQYVNTKKPTVFVFENVVALTHTTHQNYFARVLSGLTKSNLYDVSYAILDTKLHGGLPQSRPRMYLVGVLKSKKVAPMVWPTEVKCCSLDKLLPKICSNNAKSPDLSGMNATNLRNMSSAYQYIKSCGGDPISDTWVVDLDMSTKFGLNGGNVKFGIMPCLTKARCASSSYYLTNRGARLNITSMKRLQGVLPKRLVKPSGMTARQFRTPGMKLFSFSCLSFPPPPPLN